MTCTTFNEAEGSGVAGRWKRICSSTELAGNNATDARINVGGASRTALAIGMALAGITLAPDTAFAGSCTQTAPGSNVWVCSGLDVPFQDVTQNISGSDGATVNTSPNFGITVYRGNAISIANSFNPASTGDITFNDNNSSLIHGGSSGLRLNNSSVGSIYVNSNGNVESDSNSAIFAVNSSYGNNIIINAHDTSGGNSGIYANNNGTGMLSISSSGQAFGMDQNGISAINSENSTDLLIQAGVTRTIGYNAISAENFGHGVLSINSGDAQGYMGGIYAQNSSNGTDLTIVTEKAYGFSFGIDAENFGSGALTISSSDTVNSPFGNAIIATNSSNGTTLSVTVKDVRGETSGIVTDSNGSGGATISVSGTVQAGTVAAIDTMSQAGDPIAAPGSATTISISSSGRVVAGSSGLAIRNDDGNSVVNVAAGGQINGMVQLGAGSDSVNLSDANVFAGITMLDGGDDVGAADGMIDVLNLNAGFTGNLIGAIAINWEAINLNGSTVGFSDAAVTVGSINVNSAGRLLGTNNLSVNGNVAIAPGGTLVAGNGAGTNTMVISGGLFNAGTLDMRSSMGASAASDRLTIGGNYVGVSGSTIRLDIAFGAGSSPADQLMINGNLSGSSTLVISNTGSGTGGLTSGDGIKLVQVNGSSTAGALVLAGGAFNVGAFKYELYNGGVSNPNDQDWYLRSRMTDIIAPMQSVARVSQDMGLAALGTLHERVGDRNMRLGNGVLSGIWSRTFGKDYVETSRSAALGNGRSNGQLGGMQMGVDLLSKGSGIDGKVHAGIYGTRVWSGTTDFITAPVVARAGRTRSDGWLAGGYVTFQTPGWYFDGVVQGGRFDHHANATDGTRFGTTSDSLMASAEVGAAFGGNWKLEPQIQLIYSHTGVEGFTDSASTTSAVSSDDAILGRAGLRLKRTWDHDPNAIGGLFTIYGKANVWNTLSEGRTGLTFGTSAPYGIEFKRTWADVGAGTTFKVGSIAEFFADADVEFGIDQPATALSGRMGFRINW